jgi:hypothetical protein
MSDAPPDPDPGADRAGCWHAPAAVVAAALERATLIALDDLGVIEVTGTDAATFLHGQLTNRVEKLEVDRFQLTGYCNPKGRLIATFHHWRDSERHFLQLPREILPPVLRRLTMFVLRAKAKLADGSPNWHAFGVLGRDAEARIAALGVPLPLEPWRAAGSTADGLLVARLPPSPRAGARFLVVAARSRSDELERLWLAAGGELGAQPEARTAWWWSEIDSGVPTVFAATQEQFVPQMINFEVLGGVDFRKGCYPGQEVVARSQYRSALRRRLGVAHAASARVAQDLFLASGSGGADQPVGSVVMAASAPDGGMDLLYESTAAAGESLRTADQDLTVRQLPYPIVDTTA